MNNDFLARTGWNQLHRFTRIETTQATFPLSCAAAQCIRSAAHCISIDSKTSYKIRAFNRKQAPHLRYDSIVLQIQGAIS